MKHIYFLSLPLLILTGTIQSQQKKDSIEFLPEIFITAFEQNRKIQQVPASVIFIGYKQLQQFNNTGLLPALNSLQGVRMEERSPGSYRMNIRGSALRAPFGVRNVKTYLNDIPFTDPGGNTYLNQFSFFNIQSIEVIKGPSGSLYGAGNGGVLLLKTNNPQQKPGIGLQMSFGNYGLQNYNVVLKLGTKANNNTFSYSRLKTDGYRAQTNLKRDVFTWNGQYQLSEKSKVNSLFLLGDLYYQTPGGLTEAEFKADPKMARPKVGAFPSAEQAKAAIDQKTFFAGISHTYAFTKQLRNTSSVYTAFSRIQNPSIRNYERRTEPHVGARTVFQYQPIKDNNAIRFHFGAEIQNGWFTTKVYMNKNGLSDSLQTEDELNPKNGSIFAQSDVEIKNWIFTLGSSINYNKITVHRLSVVPNLIRERTYKNEISPRIAILRKINTNLNVYASVAKGFSPPTTAEVLPSTSIISTTLNAEEGWNYETGAKWQPKNNLFLELNVFKLKLKNTITQRKDASGADYFVNAGTTNQKGLEFSAKYRLNRFQTRNFIPSIWTNYTFHAFEYEDYKQLNNDFSGKKLPGVPQQTINAGLDIQFLKTYYTNISFNYVSTIPLNDANTFKSADYYLMGIRAGFRKKIANKFLCDFFIHADNIFNETYSLGNDINAAGNRFFNAAPKRNFTVGFQIYMDSKKED